MEIPSKLSIQLANKIKNKKAKVAIIGVGYVGEQLARYCASVGFLTFGIDINTQKLEKLQKEKIPNLILTDNISILSNSDIICVCVPTPLDSSLKPDLTFIKRAAEDIADNLKQGHLIIIESTIAPFSTREIVLPIIQNGKKGGIDFFLAYSPERIDPGNQKFNIKNTPKIVSGLENNSLQLACSFYKNFVDEVVQVSSLEVAEMSKILENVFRFVNISLINELSDYTSSLGINIYDVIAASSTKPYAFIPHYPGPGIGGHCIPVDPIYLLEHAKKMQIPLKMIEDSIEINRKRTQKIVSKAFEVVNGRLANGKARILIVGVAYKPDTDDTRESPAVKILDMAKKAGAEVAYHDPLVPTLGDLKSENLTNELLSKQDVIIVTTAHNNISYDLLLAANKPIIDTRNVFVYTSKPQIVKI